MWQVTQANHPSSHPSSFDEFLWNSASLKSLHTKNCLLQIKQGKTSIRHWPSCILGNMSCLAAPGAGDNWHRRCGRRQAAVTAVGSWSHNAPNKLGRKPGRPINMNNLKLQLQGNSVLILNKTGLQYSNNIQLRVWEVKCEFYGWMKIYFHW